MAEPDIFYAGSDTAGKTCAICQSTIVAGESILYCPDCGLPFHDECWKENHGCSQYGCSSAPETAKEESAAVASSSVWGDEKDCPACGKKIKARAQKCRWCGANFGTRDLVSAGEYASREYEGKEYTVARNKVVGIFLCTATGCLAPLGAIAFGILIFRKKFLGIEFQRLPPALRVLCMVGFGLGCLLALVCMIGIAVKPESGLEL